jgi:hypothetical protein
VVLEICHGVVGFGEERISVGGKGEEKLQAGGGIMITIITVCVQKELFCYHLFVLWGWEFFNTFSFSF